MTHINYVATARTPSVTSDEYRRRAKLALDASQFPAPQLLEMMEAFFRGYGADVAATKIKRGRAAAIAEFSRLREAMTQREYIPQAAQIELLAELRSRAKS